MNDTFNAIGQATAQINSSMAKALEAEHRANNPALVAHEVILKSIKAFEALLDDDHETGIYLACFGQSILMEVCAITRYAPTLISFIGLVDGNKSQLIQHVNQLNFLLTSVPKREPDKPARRIGFSSQNE